MSTGASQAKRPRLERLSCLRVSPRSLTELCRRVREEGLPEHTSRATFQKNTHDIARQETPYGEIVQDVVLPGEGLVMGVQAPFPMLHHLGEHSAAFCSALERTQARYPASYGHP